MTKHSKQIIKQITFWLIALMATNAGCTDAPVKSDTPQQHNTASAETKVMPNKDITDPVCGMIKDSTWTDYTMYKGDTVWFCAATEKKAFIANPEKYIK